MSQASQPTTRPASNRPASAGPQPGPSGVFEATLVPENGWHFLHLFYKIDRAVMAQLSESDRQQGREQLLQALDKTNTSGVEQLQSFAIVGHKANFGIMLAGLDLPALLSVQTSIEASKLGPALVPAYSFYSLTEVSEYVPDVEAYGRILQEQQGLKPEDSAYQTRLKQYENRLEGMNRQRMYPEFPDWPVVCFYPMSKMRTEGQNWYLLPFEERFKLMGDHGRTGMTFAGRVTQLITASTGLDDWEWGVTLWSKNPSYLKEIVYKMRYDHSSAKYALFGPFYPGYILPPEELLQSFRL